MDEFSRMVNETTEGQHMELGWVAEKEVGPKEIGLLRNVRPEDLLVHRRRPLPSGRHRSRGSPPGVLEELQEFGVRLGVAFQIQDDTLNLVGDEKKYGKAKSDDILEGKRTLILLHLLGCGQPERAGQGGRHHEQGPE